MGTELIWTPLSVSPHINKTLPEVMFADPTWFYAEAFNRFRKLDIDSEVQEIWRRATRIRLPVGMIAEHIFHRPSNKYSHFRLVPEDQPVDNVYDVSLRTTWLDLGLPHTLARGRDRTGGSSMISCLKAELFGDRGRVMTRARCEAFFNDDANFFLTGPLAVPPLSV